MSECFDTSAMLISTNTSPPDGSTLAPSQERTTATTQNFSLGQDPEYPLAESVMVLHKGRNQTATLAVHAGGKNTYARLTKARLRLLVAQALVAINEIENSETR